MFRPRTKYKTIRLATVGSRKTQQAALVKNKRLTGKHKYAYQLTILQNLPRARTLLHSKSASWSSRPEWRTPYKSACNRNNPNREKARRFTSEKGKSYGSIKTNASWKPCTPPFISFTIYHSINHSHTNPNIHNYLYLARWSLMQQFSFSVALRVRLFQPPHIHHHRLH